MPKSQILTEAQAFGKAPRKSSGQAARGYIYRPKISTERIDYKSDSASAGESGQRVIKKQSNMF